MRQEDRSIICNMREVEKRAEPTNAGEYSVRADEGSRSFLSAAHKTALSLVRRVANQNRFEANRWLSARYDPMTMGRGLAQLSPVLTLEFGSDEH